MIGGFTSESAEKGRDLYAQFVSGEIVLTDATTAEMVKLMENTYRDVNIAIANEFSRLADRFGIDVWEAIKIANLHPRVNILNPGPGVGGHCISVDPWFLVEAAPEITPLIYTAREVNDFQPEFVVDLVKMIIGEPKGQKIGAFGLTYKPDVDDFRESPAINIVFKLTSIGYDVYAYDPYMNTETFKEIKLGNSINEITKDASLLIILVSHSLFINLDPTQGNNMKQKNILDSTNLLNMKNWMKHGFSCYKLSKFNNDHPSNQ